MEAEQVMLDEHAPALLDTRCWRCEDPAAVIVTHVHQFPSGPRAYCSAHFLALGSLPSGAACAPTLELRRHAVEIRNCA
jgi:hypothetical protein